VAVGAAVRCFEREAGRPLDAAAKELVLRAAGVSCVQGLFFHSNNYFLLEYVDDASARVENAPGTWSGCSRTTRSWNGRGGGPTRPTPCPRTRPFRRRVDSARVEGGRAMRVVYMQNPRPSSTLPLRRPYRRREHRRLLCMDLDSVEDLHACLAKADRETQDLGLRVLAVARALNGRSKYQGGV